MIVLKNERVLLFNNPKCGSTSLREYMKPYSINIEDVPYWLPECYYYEYYNDFQLKKVHSLRKMQAINFSKRRKQFSVIHSHIRPLDAIRIIMDSAESSLAYNFNDYEKICFTRNPWARIYSLWKMLKVQKITKSFTDFVFRLDEILHSESHPVTRYVIEGTKSFVSDTGGNIMVDKIFKLEDTAEFTDYMAEKYNIPRKNFAHVNSRTTDFPSYESQYNSKTIKIIESRYQWEIDHFKYKFGE